MPTCPSLWQYVHLMLHLSVIDMRRYPVGMCGRAVLLHVVSIRVTVFVTLLCRVESVLPRTVVCCRGDSYAPWCALPWELPRMHSGMCQELANGTLINNQRLRTKQPCSDRGHQVRGRIVYSKLSKCALSGRLDNFLAAVAVVRNPTDHKGPRCGRADKRSI